VTLCHHYGGSERIVSYLTEELLDKIRSRAAEFDLLHFHIDYFHFPVFGHLPLPTLTTLHGRHDLRDCLPFYGFKDMPVVSISDAQRAPVPLANNVATSPRS
jgi:hypothetical protein